MDFISTINMLKDVPTEKIVILFSLMFTSFFAYYVLKNNTKAINGLNSTLQTITTNQILHDERNRSDFSIVKTDISRVEKDVESARGDVSSLQGDILDIKGNMVTRNEITVVHNRLDSIVTTVGKIEGKVM